MSLVNGERVLFVCFILNFYFNVFKLVVVFDNGLSLMCIWIGCTFVVVVVETVR